MALEDLVVLRGVLVDLVVVQVFPELKSGCVLNVVGDVVSEIIIYLN